MGVLGKMNESCVCSDCNELSVLEKLFGRNNIASVGVPLIFAKIATGAISLTGKTTAQFIDMIKTKFKL